MKSNATFRQALFVCSLLLAVSGLVYTQNQPKTATDNGVTAIRNAKIVTVTGETIPRGTRSRFLRRRPYGLTTSPTWPVFCAGSRLDKRKGYEMIKDAADRRKLASMLHLGTVRLRTDRLDLLPIDRTHAEGLFAVLKDPRLYGFTGGEPPIDASSLARTYEFWETRASPDGTELWFNWAVSLRVHQLLIGYVQAGIHSDYADMAWVVGSEWQQQGYATEAARSLLRWAFDTLDLNRVQAEADTRNLASARVLEKLGFVREGTLREDCIVNGEVSDSWVFGLLRREWRPPSEPGVAPL